MNDYAMLDYAATVLVEDYMLIRGDEEVLITTDTSTDMVAVQALMTAVDRRGARCTVITRRPLPYQGLLADPFISQVQAESMQHCDAWIDMCFPYFAGSTAWGRAMARGQLRYLLLGDVSAAGLGRLFGMMDMDKYRLALRAFQETVTNVEGKVCRITNSHGSDFRFILGDVPDIEHTSQATKPGFYTVPGACPIPMKPESVQGRIVVTASFHEFYEKLAGPLIMELNGEIQHLTGGGVSRGLLDRALRRAGGGRYGSVIHLTHGIHPAARLTGGSFIEDMRTIGSNAVGLGIPWDQPGGGENHPDAVLENQSLWIDDMQVIEEGVVIAPEPLARAVEALVPLRSY